MLKMLRVSLFFVIVCFMAFSTTYFEDIQAACYCVDPSKCACSSPPPTGVPLFDAEFNGIPLKCTDERDPNSVFSIKDPVCDGRWNNEIPPYCAWSGQGEITCWGIGFVDNPGTAFSTDGRWIEWPDLNMVLNFNGFTSDKNANGLNEEDEIRTYVGCSANVFCCGRKDTCESDPANDQITGGCGPKGNVANGAVEALCHGYDGKQGVHSGEGESRLWFSQVRLVSTLSAIAQTMFNPFKLDGRYQDTALSKNSPVSDPSGRIDNQGTLTTRVERYQGVHDDTIVVNQTDNNSSVVVKNPAPPHLFSFENDPERDNFPYDDSRACYMPDALENPGDDLVGPRIKGELLFTEKFTYTPLPNTDCVADGVSYIPAAGDNVNRCCSQKTSTGNACRRLVSGETCDPDTETNQVCSGVQSCCPIGSACGDSAVLCVAPDPIELPAEGYTEVFSKTPMIELIYNTIVDGTDSLYKRFFPISSWVSHGETVPFEEIPAKTGFKASVSGNVDSVSYAEGQSSTPEVYFPHLGSLDKYWLYDFQKGLRPKGYARGQADPLGDGGTNPFESIACPAPINLPEIDDPGIKCSLNCNNVSDAQVLSAASAAGVNGQYLLDIKDNFISLAERWVATGGENSGARQCYNDAVKRSLDARINPIFTLAIWVHESGASNYDSNVTYCDPNDANRTVRDFGVKMGSIGPIAANFDAQITRFLQLPYDYPNDTDTYDHDVNSALCFTGSCNWGNFSQVYKLGPGGGNGCTISPDAISYGNTILTTMRLISTTCAPVYPTDLSCLL